MKLQQLRYALEVHRHGNHISAAAEALHTSQPGISKQIQLLESELGFEIFSRKRNRIVGLSEPGREVMSIAQRMLADADNLRNLGEDFTSRSGGSLIIATTHTQARYVLPKVIERFVKKHPAVRLGLRQGNPTQICELVESGEADIAIGTETIRDFPNLVRLPCFKLSRSVIAKLGHPLLQTKKLTLREIAKYPIITYDPAYSGRWKVMDAFRNAGIEPNVIFGAMDADVSKTYVELGLGIAILTTISFDSTHDKGLRARDASHLFEPSTTFVALRPYSYLRTFVFDFIKSLAPNLSAEFVKAALKKSAG
ncbi:MAG: CysB family HTH-type transcriptional regulator [Betaproteobacteria bacterium]|nr:CysB family HTH-type transcriptional regulator [Betaproteobacteria bacterium]